MTTWWLPGDYLVTSWQPDDCQMTVWWLSDVWYWLKLAMKFKIPFMQHFYLIFLHCVFAERPAIWCSQTPASTELETRTRFNEHFRNVFYRSFIFGLLCYWHWILWCGKCLSLQFEYRILNIMKINWYTNYFLLIFNSSGLRNEILLVKRHFSSQFCAVVKRI